MPSKSIVYANGAGQNTKFLFDLLTSLGHEVAFYVSHAQANQQITLGGRLYPAYTHDEFFVRYSKLDVILEGTLVVNQPKRVELREKYDTRVVSMLYGHTMILDMENIFIREDAKGRFYAAKPDQVWISPHHAKAAGYLGTVFDAEVSVMPYIWEPDFVQLPFSEGEYKALRDVVVMEPNRYVMKNALIPMAIIERLWRDEPEIFDRAIVANGHHWRDREYFKRNILANFRSLHAQSNKVFFSGRNTFDELFPKPRVMLAHQWECELNYTYLEALYKGVPLVHNSGMLSDYGYYYPEFDVVAGSEALRQALQDSDLTRHCQESRTAISQFSINNPANQAGYQQLLDDVVSR